MDLLPVFFDRADGLDGRIGTPVPDGSIDVSAANGATTVDDIQTEELATSPEIERGEQCTTTKMFKMSYAQAKQQIAALSRGTVQSDSFGNVVRVLSAKLAHEKTDMALLTVVTEALSFDTPPDEFQIVPVELGIDILKHPRYRFALDPTPGDESSTVAVGDTDVSISNIKQAIIRAVQTYRDSPFFPSADNINGLVHNNIFAQFLGGNINVQVPNGTFDPTVDETDPPFWNGVAVDIPDTSDNPRYFIVPVPSTSPAIALAMAAAQEIIGKIWRGEDTPLLTGFEVTWAAYYFHLQAINPGSYIEDPLSEASPALPDYFWGTDLPLDAIPPRGGNPETQVDGTPTIFDQMARLNPQCYSDDGTESGEVILSSLRKADEIEYGRTWFKHIRRWTIVPIGVWDADVYSKGARPSVAGDYHGFINPS